LCFCKKKKITTRDSTTVCRQQPMLKPQIDCCWSR
jgi:hypothetical protein